MTTTREINRHIDSRLDGNGQLVYVVEFTGDDGEARYYEFADHANAYAFVRDEIIPPTYHSDRLGAVTIPEEE